MDTLTLLTTAGAALDISHHDGLPRATPGQTGIDPGRIDRLLDDAAAAGIELDSFMLWHDGFVVAEGWWWPYRADRPHMMHSATKSFLSAAVGLAIAESRFALDDRVASFFPDRVSPEPTSNLARMTVKDLLTQTSGHPHGMSGGKWRAITTSWIDEFLKIPVAYEPGTKFTYSSATSFMLSAIISRTTGMNAHAYLTPRLLAPLGIADLSWDVGPEGINPGGNGISCTTADLLKLAILHVQGGVWNGRQLLPRAWVEAATTPQRGNEHGYHWWTGPHRSFYAYGVFGQFAWAYPEQRGVLAVTAAVPGHEEALRALAARHLPDLFLPAPPSRSSVALASRCAALRLLPPEPDKGVAPSAIGIDRIWFAAANDDGVAYFRVRTDDDAIVFHLGDARGEHVVEAGLLTWRESDTTMTGAKLHHGYEPASLRVVAGGRWIDGDTIEMTWQFVETAFRDTVVIRIDGDAATLDRSVNVNTFPTVRPTIHGMPVPEGAPADHTTLMASHRNLVSAHSSASSPAYAVARTPVRELLGTPATRAVLDAVAPFLARHPRIEEAGPYVLSDLVQYLPTLTPELLRQIDAQLARIGQGSAIDR